MDASGVWIDVRARGAEPQPRNEKHKRDGQRAQCRGRMAMTAQGELGVRSTGRGTRNTEGREAGAGAGGSGGGEGSVMDGGINSHQERSETPFLLMRR